MLALTMRLPERRSMIKVLILVVSTNCGLGIQMCGYPKIQIITAHMRPQGSSRRNNALNCGVNIHRRRTGDRQDPMLVSHPPLPALRKSIQNMRRLTTLFAPVANLTRCLSAFAVSVSLLPATAGASGIFEFEGHTYRIVAETADWETASLKAAEMSLNGGAGYLVRIDSQEENRALIEALAAHLTDEQLKASVPDDGSDIPFVWLGGSDIAREGVWTWSNNGDQFWEGDFNGTSKNGLYSNWGVQPDSASGAEDGAAMGLGDWPEPFYDLGAMGEWNDLDIDSSLMYVVEFDSISDLQVAIDQPIRNEVHSGIGMVRGWAVSSEPIERVKIYIDGTYRFDVPHGDRRNELAKRFPDNERASESGFSSAFNWNQLGSASRR